MIRFIPRLYSRILSRSLFIQSTPNPNSQQFFPEKTVLEKGTKDFLTSMDTTNSPLTTKLFTISGIKSVFLGPDFITVTKNDSLDWQVMKPLILGAIMDHFNSDEPTINKETNDKREKSLLENSEDSDIVKQIKELLDTRVRPAVAMDGGDIVYDNFENGIVYLHMQGACSGCPSSTATLKMGIENMLKHYIPEVKEVRPVDA